MGLPIEEKVGSKPLWALPKKHSSLTKGRWREPGASATKEWDKSKVVSAGWSCIHCEVAEGEANGEVWSPDVFYCFIILENA